MRTVAITREVSPAIAFCELTHLERTSIDLDLARRQHESYEAVLARLGCEIRRLPAEPDLPDSVFVEDIAVVLDELAVLMRPGAESRRPETAGIAAALEPMRPLRHIEPPGTLDGGDVLRLGRRLYVGRSSRSNDDGIEQLRRIVDSYGYTVSGVAMSDCLHLKSAVTPVGERTLLLDRARVDAGAFDRAELLDVHPSEPDAANALRIGDATIMATSHPRTRERLEAHGIAVVTVDVSEIMKAEGGVTCCSLIFDVTETNG